MLYVSASLFSIFATLAAVTTQDIDKAFLLNNPSLIHARFSTRSRLAIYLPEPLSFSDQLSDQQAFFLFQNIFKRFSTMEFFPESQVNLVPEEGRFLFRARWSFQDRANNDRFVFRLFILLQKEKPAPGSLRRNSRSIGPPLPALWKITEIKAEKI